MNLIALEGGKSRHTDDILRRVPPNNPEAEQVVLGSILLDNDAIHAALDIINADDFYREAHREIFRAMVTISESSRPIESTILVDAIRTAGKLEMIGGAGYIADLSASEATARHVEHYARIVKRKSTLRAVHTAAMQISSGALDDPADFESFLSSAEQQLAPLFEQALEGTAAQSVATLAIETLAAIESAPDKPRGLRTQLVEIDQLTGGLHPGEVTVLAGRTGSGKTTLAATIAANVARLGYGVAFFSLEMSKEQIMTRFLCAEAEVFASRARSARFSEHDLKALGAAAAEVASWPLTVIEGAVTSSKIKAVAQRLSRKKPLRLIVVDYLHLMTSQGRSDNREREVSAISRAIKLLAMDLKIPILLLSQLNRRPMVEQRRPQLSDLRESGQIENDGDQVWFIFRQDGHDPARANQPGPAEVIVAKQRNGPTGVAMLMHHPEFVKFTNPPAAEAARSWQE
jgi:replicative DNA helicase